MPNLENLSPFEVVDLPSQDRDARGLLLVVAAGRYVLPKGGETINEAPPICDEQRPPPMEDEYFGEPDASSLKYEGQSSYTRPGTDIYVHGSAQSFRGQATTAMMVEVHVGSLSKLVMVVGDRTYRAGMIGTSLSDPVPFTEMPLLWERAFGGAMHPEGPPGTWEPRNPVGVGLYENGRSAEGRPAPNLEDPRQPITGLSDRPRPMGFGPIARHWSPRVEFAGTYDEAWVEERAPLWPLDLDERLFCAAAPGLSTPRYLVGGEPVQLVGFSRDGPIGCLLPAERIQAKARFRDREIRQLMTMDAVLIEPDEGALTVIWRTAIPAHRALQDHEVTLVRRLEPWEEFRP